MADELFELLKAVRDEPSFVAFARALQTDREAADAESPTLDGGVAQPRIMGDERIQRAALCFFWCGF